MKQVYIAVAALFLASVLLFVAAFVYLDRTKHATYFYTVSLGGGEIGTIRVEKFATEDKLIYKSAADVPFYPALTKSKSKITLDRRYGLDTYSRERYDNGAAESVYLERADNTLSFVSVFDSQFACLNNIPVKGAAFVFEEDSPVTYLPLVENYDFRRGRSQGFNAVTVFSPSLPPMRRFVTFTSVRDEYVEVGQTKVKTERLLLKIKNYPQGVIHVAKSDRSLVMVELPEKGLRIKRTSAQRAPEPKTALTGEKGYSSRDAAFKSGNVKLSGTLTLPAKEGPNPAALLVWGEGSDDRDYQGLFASLADRLAREGVCVLRFDKRGIGASGGDFSALTDRDMIDDLKAGIDFLISQNEVDPQRIALVSHGEGAYHAARASSEKPSVKAIIMMAPSYPLSMNDNTRAERLGKMASRSRWSDDYLKLAVESDAQTGDIVKKAKSAWAIVVGKRCFVKKMRERLDEPPVRAFTNLTIPVAILEGKAGGSADTDLAASIDRRIGEGGNAEHSLIYFDSLGRLFGALVNDGVSKMRYEVDPAVAKTIGDWLGTRLRPAAEAPTAPSTAGV